MWIVHHFLRVIWSNILGIIFNIYYFLLVAFSKKHREKYKYNKKCWDNISTVKELSNYFQNNYKYKYDGYKGIVDHNNFKYEFFCSNGDCDDVANWACKKLREQGFVADVYGFADFKSKPIFWHYDCVFRLDDINTDSLCFLFNYGHNNKVHSNIGDTMKDIYHRSYCFKKIKYWKCKYM